MRKEYYSILFKEKENIWMFALNFRCHTLFKFLKNGFYTKV